MDPTVTAAAIGVTGTVIVGLAGFGATTWTTRQTTASARESRIWDKRAATYVDMLAAIQNRRITRMALISDLGNRSPFEGRPVVSTHGANGEGPDWHDLEARLQAFASESVLTAVQASSTAAADFHRAASSFWPEIYERLPPAATEAAAELAEATDQAREAVEEVRKAADDADDEVVKRIRAELQGRGRPLGNWQPAVGLEPPAF